MAQGQGWHGDPEGHAEAARERDNKVNWLPLLLIPLAFVLGVWGGNAMDNNNRQDGTQVGVGGGPVVPCISPTSTMMQDNGQ